MTQPLTEAKPTDAARDAARRVRDDPADAILFLCSSPSLSRGAFARLEAACAKATKLPHRLIRLEDTGASLFDALNEMREAGRRSIRLQPVSLPFPENLIAWLPGVLAHWRSAPENAGICTTLGPEPGKTDGALTKLVASTLALPARAMNDGKPRLGKPGWEMPPDYEFHIMVCTGPRCHLRDAGGLPQIIKAECAEAGISDRCLTTRTGCIHPCNKGPVVVLYPRGDWFHIPDRTAVRRFVRDVLIAGGSPPDLLFHSARAGGQS